MRILVLDHETPWVKSLFLATPAGIQVEFLGVCNIRDRRHYPSATALGMFRGRRLGPDHVERYVWVPAGLRRLTRWWLAAYCRFAYAGRRPDWVVATNPFAAHLRAAFAGSRSAYDVYDPYEYYPHWGGAEGVRPLERQLVERCDLVFAVSRQLQADLTARYGRPVAYLPNAADGRWLSTPAGERPADLPLGRPTVGCVGQMNGTYDWPLIGDLAARRPEVTFVFVGPNVEGDPVVQGQIAAVLAMPNVCWLGPRPHGELRRYMSAFDVCLCPLKVDAHSNRRSPLRLYDYLTTDRPVMSTDVAEAREHREQVWIGRNLDEWDALLGDALAGRRQVDVAARRRYMAGQTWTVRASELLALLVASPVV